MTDTAPITRIVAAGPMRSGNVLLERLCTAHPSIAPAGPLDGLLERGRLLGASMTSPLPLSARATLARCAEDTWTPVESSLGRPGVASFDTLDALHRLLLHRQAASATHVWVRMHRPMSFVSALARQPDVRCICLIRDGRDVLLSRRARGDRDLDEYLWQWRRFARLAQDLQRRGLAHIVRFEDLVEDPVRIARELSEFLAVRLDFESGALEWPTHSSFGALPPRFDPTTLERWRRRPGDELVGYVEDVCRDELVLWGYEVDVVAPALVRIRHAGRTRGHALRRTLREARAKRRARLSR